MIHAEQLHKAIDDLGLADRPAIVHTSLRSFGEPLDGGADALLDALLARGLTVVVPSFTEPQFGVTPVADLRPERNGIDYTALLDRRNDRVYRPDCGLVNPALGAFPATVIRRTEAVRGTHPLNSFAAIGPRAVELIAQQSPTDVYGPIHGLAALGGVVLQIGVGLTTMTALHLAEQRSGRRLFLRWARDADGEVRAVEVGSCSKGFGRLEPILRPHRRTTAVRSSLWQAYPVADVLTAATAAIAANQDITRCSGSDCPTCRDSVAGGPIGVTTWAERPSP
jgi:aminoglycoside N3'-acetyltransferase